MNGPLLMLALTLSYPVDEGARTGIRRLDWQRAVDAGKARGRKLPPGARWPGERVRLRLTDAPAIDVGPDAKKDPELQSVLQKILDQHAFRGYGVALLDISNPQAPRYAGVHEDRAQTPGSVAKVLVAAALLGQVKARFGDDIARRQDFLRNTTVAADAWLMPNSHEVPVVGPKDTHVRAVRAGDRFTLWEWLDHALSPSSNAAGTLVWREATLMALLGDAYPPQTRDAALYARWSKDEFTAAAFRVIDEPLAAAGLDPAQFKLRAFFTKGAGRYLKASSSRCTPAALVRWMTRVEQGRMVDPWSSLELKKMLYLTRRRVRYAQAPSLTDAAVYFKSGSLFLCRPEPGYQCGQYRGNDTNVLNALVEVETEDGKLTYIVAVMSNELKKNAATDHGRLAEALHVALRPKR